MGQMWRYEPGKTVTLLLWKPSWLYKSPCGKHKLCNPFHMNPKPSDSSYSASVSPLAGLCIPSLTMYEHILYRIIQSPMTKY